jgi:hypothetical protein
MPAQASLAPDLHAELVAIYEEVMWLSHRPNVTASSARAWYTHIMSERIKRRMRQFTDKVSRSAAENDAATLRLEHFKRIQTTLTSLVGRHRENKRPNPEEFVRVLVECESAHIVTLEENYTAMRAEGNYRKAGIELVSWRALPLKRQAMLWKKMLRGKVANAEAYAPRPNVLA